MARVLHEGKQVIVGDIEGTATAAGISLSIKGTPVELTAQEAETLEEVMSDLFHWVPKGED